MEDYSSDADSEEDRRAYGQYATLAIDSDIDDDAAAYLMSVRNEAASIPDIMIASQAPAAEAVLPQHEQRKKVNNRMGLAGVDTQRHTSQIRASHAWVHQFLSDFNVLRETLNSFHAEENHACINDSEDERFSTKSEDRLAPPSGLADLKQLPQEEIAKCLEKAVDDISVQENITALDGYTIYSLCAVLDYPADADVDACLTKLLRTCRTLQCQSDAGLQALVDMLNVIAGVCFGQDLELKQQFRDDEIVL